MDHESPGKKRDAPDDGGAPKSYSVLHPEGSLQRDVRSDAEDAGGPAAVELLGVVCHMEPQHSESYIGAQHPADIRLGGAARRLVPPVRHGQVRLDGKTGGRHVHTEPGPGENVGHLRTRHGAADCARGARAPLAIERDGNQAPTHGPKVRHTTDRRRARAGAFRLPARARRRSVVRSEEHTSELQSRSDLVCRLLLEKKKTADAWRRALMSRR